MIRVHVDVIAGHGYASDVRLTAEIPDGHGIGAYYMGHRRIILAVPQKMPAGLCGVPLPAHEPRYYDDGPGFGTRIHLSPINPLEWNRGGTCPCDGAVLWRLDARAPDPVLCIAEWGMYGWEWTFRPLTARDLQPEITAREAAVAPALAGAGFTES